MPSIDKKYYHNLDLDSNEIKAGRIYNLTTTQRNALSLTTSDKGYLVYDITLLSLFVWNGTAWVSAGGSSQNLQQVVNTGNGISNYGGTGTASIQSTNFTNGRTLYLNDNANPTIKIVDNANASNYLQIDIDTLNIDGVSYNWSSIVNPNIPTLQQVTTSGAITTNTITVGDLAGLFSQVLPDAVGTQSAFLGTYAYIDSTGFLGLYNGTMESRLLNTNVTNVDVWLEFPDEAAGTYIIPTNVNGEYADSTGKITLAAAGFEQNFLLMGA
jgi:hypothetical protein